MIKDGNKWDLDYIVLCNEILKKYEESNKNDPPTSELVKGTQQNFYGLVKIIKLILEYQVQVNEKILRLISLN